MNLGKEGVSGEHEMVVFHGAKNSFAEQKQPGDKKKREKREREDPAYVWIEAQGSDPAGGGSRCLAVLGTG